MTYTIEKMPKSGDTVLVGLSGGVDSAVTALILKDRGCHVKCATMTLWDGKFFAGKTSRRAFCFSPESQKIIPKCREFCKQNGFEYFVFNLSAEFFERVIKNFKSEYRAGRTPNPCVICNREIKFGAMIFAAQNAKIDFDFFCTGHYAAVVRPDKPFFGGTKCPPMIFCAQDEKKDQSYFLSRVPQEILEQVRFPLFKIKKSEVQERAKLANLFCAQNKESQDFLSKDAFSELFSDLPSIPGNFLSEDGKILGQHRGIEHYTIGQRRGLEIALNKIVYVSKIDAEKNTIILSEAQGLFCKYFFATDFLWSCGEEPKNSFNATVKIRAATRAVPCCCEKTQNAAVWKISFLKPERAVTPGQFAVFYDSGGVIASAVIQNFQK